MKLPIDTDGLALPVSSKMLNLLNQVFSEQDPPPTCLDSLQAITFNFNDPTYSPEDGGYHPVEIRLGRHGNHYRFEYLTDFSYVGSGHFCEIAKEIDFDVVCPSSTVTIISD